MLKKQILILSILIFCISIISFLPKPKYESFEISNEIPWYFLEWKSHDMKWLLKKHNQMKNMIGDIFIRNYTNLKGQNLLFSILNAGNFHDPKVCFTGSGYQLMELENTQLTFGKQIIKAPTIIFKNKNDTRLLIYWLCIDKKIASWSQQKILEFFNSILNQKKIRLMVRVEVPIKEDNIEEAILLAKTFFKNLYSQTINSEYLEYIFGELSIPEIKKDAQRGTKETINNDITSILWDSEF